MSKNLRHLTSVVILAGSIWLVGGCSSVPLPTKEAKADEVTPLPVDALMVGPAQSAIPVLIVAEREASIAKDLATLSSFWHEDAQIVDGRNTVDPSDDYVWRGKDAILDRYVLAVFPNPPLPLEQTPQPEMSIDGKDVIAVNGVDRWRFTQTDGRWQIAELIYLKP